MDNFGKRLKLLRLSRELSLEELAQATGLAVATIKRFERRGTRPSLPTVKKLADKLNILPNVLTGKMI